MAQRAPRCCASLLAAALVLLAGCSSASSRGTEPTPTTSPIGTVAPVSFQTTVMRVGDRAISMEVAATPAQSERGLGYRDSLDADSGMIFDLHGTREQDFWMKGMRFPLDMVWVGAEKRVTQVTANRPAEPGVPDDRLERYSSDTPVAYVIEVNANAAQRLGLTPGAQLSFELPPSTQ